MKLGIHLVNMTDNLYAAQFYEPFGIFWVPNLEPLMSLLPHIFIECHVSLL